MTSSGLARLSSSEARVTVYKGTNVVKTFTVPTGQIGTLWDVCEYDPTTNTITSVNKVYRHYGSSKDVGMDETELQKKQIARRLFDISSINNAANEITGYDESSDYD